MKKQNVYAAIIGGGAGGMMCAIRAAERHPKEKIVILEKADRVGKKLLVTGNGRCNLSHVGADARSYHGEGSAELINILFKKYNTNAVLRYFHTLGLLTHTDHEGRVYPLSNQSSSVLDVLRKRLAELSVVEYCGAEIQSIQKTAQGYEIVAADRRIFAKKAVIAVGGKNDYVGRESGSRELMRALGVGTTKVSPSLSPVRVKNDLLKSLKGIRAQAEVSLIEHRQVVKSERGEVQFAENALSGICVFNLSREANKGGCEISLNLLPDMDHDQLYKEITERTERDLTAPASDIFIGMFHKNLGLAVLKASGVRPSAFCKDISEKELKSICRHIKDWRFSCEENRDFKKAQVTAGGVTLNEIDPCSFMCKRHKELYIIGEALDIDGDCGGYNLQFAFASGMCAGDSL